MNASQREMSRNTTSVPHQDWSECCLTLRDRASPGCLEKFLAQEALAVVRQDVFQCDSRSRWRQPVCGTDQPLPGHPVTHLLGINGGGPGLGGTQLLGVIDRYCAPILSGGRLIGFQAEDAHARYCWLTGIRARDLTLSAPDQAQEVFETLEAGLAMAGMDPRNVVRTWFFNHRILDWYDDFNAVRSAFFRKRRVFDAVVPASTGVGMPNAAGAALLADAFAVLPLDGAVRIQAIPSPLQCPALDYGSSFNRAVEIESASHRRLLISGTASIDVEGRTAHVGDVRAQIELTMEVIAAILEARGMSWDQAHRGIAYVKRAADAPLFEAYCRARGLPDLHCLCTEADVCREDLLFELELEAVLA